MDDAIAWAAGTVGGLTLLGAAGGLGLLVAPPALLATEGGAEGAIGAAFFVAVFVACGLAMQIFRRGKPWSALVGASAAGLALLAFFGAPFAIDAARGDAVPARDALVLMLVLPTLAALVAAAGTLLLADGVKRYRAKHGLAHAPR